MSIFDKSYVYCARHGEYLPADNLVADMWYAEFDEPQARPAWVTDEIVDDGFAEDDPSGSQFIRLTATDEAGLLATVESLFTVLKEDEPSGDDTVYDYYPSGVLLLQAMIADLREPANVAQGKKLWQEIVDHIHFLDESGEEILKVLGLD